MMEMLSATLTMISHSKSDVSRYSTIHREDGSLQILHQTDILRDQTIRSWFPQCSRQGTEKSLLLSTTMKRMRRLLIKILLRDWEIMQIDSTVIRGVGWKSSLSSASLRLTTSLILSLVIADIVVKRVDDKEVLQSAVVIPRPDDCILICDGRRRRLVFSPAHPSLKCWDWRPLENRRSELEFWEWRWTVLPVIWGSAWITFRRVCLSHVPWILLFVVLTYWWLRL